ncbi:sulfotransferase domain-containing protein [Kineosporia babensis]|uniref:Sulfotransferase domain-containing protein n=1 Tax=Kineosporia babensis TaxID=499548 RepID=A0A9X1NCH7_9ACTN|nr:sulfotransferase domain-containing protein [Kineosporia babensis]MCD5310518.1 sulfotransferase domain-containing protein [Kineosporia babensis]
MITADSARRVVVGKEMTQLKRYDGPFQDNARWQSVTLRPDDVIVAAPMKSGTTWVQSICAMLLFRATGFDAPLSRLSPWIDMKDTPIEDVVARLEAQAHRRILKSHTPLDGLPTAEGVKTVFVARHPLDSALSWYHHLHNMDSPAMMTSLGFPPEISLYPTTDDRTWLREWVMADSAPAGESQSMNAYLDHARIAWEQRDRDDLVLLHYADLSADLEGQMRALAERLGAQVPDELWAELLEAASFKQMSARPEVWTPTQPFHDRAAFFREGRSGGGAALLEPEVLEAYRERAAQVLPAELNTWLHRPEQ